MDLPVLATPPVTPAVALSTRVLRIQFAMVCLPTQHAIRALHVPAGVALADSARQIARFVEELTCLQHVRRGALAVPSAA